MGMEPFYNVLNENHLQMQLVAELLIALAIGLAIFYISLGLLEESITTLFQKWMMLLSLPSVW